MTKIKAAQQSQNQTSQRHGTNAGLDEEMSHDDTTSSSGPTSGAALVARQLRSSSTGTTQLPPSTQSPNNTNNSTTNLPEDIAIMEIILRFLQLLCENHNSDLQNYLRIQRTRHGPVSSKIMLATDNYAARRGFQLRVQTPF